MAIVGMDGYAKAKASFTPMPTPYVGCAGPVLPDSAHVAAGKVYYADGVGVVRSLAPGGVPVTVTTFPLTSTQQMLSFAVSPDGSRLLGTIFTIPPKSLSVTDPCTAGGSASPFGSSDFTLDVYAAQPGGSPHLLHHQDLGTFGNATLSPLALLGWDAIGPLGTYPTSWATQGGGPHRYNGVPVRVDATTGTSTSPVTLDQSCYLGSMDTAPTGDFVCPTSAAIEVRRPDGSEIWHYSPPANTSSYLNYLSPDEGRIAAIGIGVVNKDQTLIALPDAYIPQGLSSPTAWLDNTTLIDGGISTNLSYLSLTAPGTIVDLGFKGVFVGTVRP